MTDWNPRVRIGVAALIVVSGLYLLQRARMREKTGGNIKRP